MKKLEIGQLGEEIAGNFLLKNGYSIIAKNYRRKFGEIDIIARSPDGILIFVEVKTIAINERSILSPEDNITTHKMRTVNRICQFFAGAHPELIDEARGWRIDVIAVEVSQNGGYKIKHYKNI